mmetsp:Transcript_56466/g.121188  ORF Transcript_56466/g.121188 Transcript_56466/m.121188 type:complete len:566 (+) Transcript_56466:20-1717(+)
MFKKPKDVQTKGENKMRGKEIKKLREVLLRELRIDEMGLNQLFPAKADIAVRKFGGGSYLTFITVDTCVAFVQVDPEAPNATYPTLTSLWRCPEALATVTIAPPVSKFVINGADVMAPGILAVDDSAQVGNFVSIFVAGNPSAVGVGVLLLSPADIISRREGRAVQAAHHFGDCLWEASGSPRPEGFNGAEVVPLSVEAPPAAQQEDAEALPGAADGKNGEAAAQAAAPSEGDDAAVAATESVAISSEDMEDRMRLCFLQAARTRIKDRDLPMPVNTLYAAHMRPSRRSEWSVDVKLTRFKKLVPFLATLEEDGLLRLKPKGSEHFLVEIVRKASEYAEFRPWPKDVTAAAGEEGGSDAAVARFQVEVLGKLAPSAAVLFGKSEYVTHEQVATILRDYGNENTLWAANNKKKMQGDEVLCSVFGEAEVVGTVEQLSTQFMKGCKKFHRVTAPQRGAAAGMKTSIRPGAPPKVTIRTDTRRGHAVTLVRGLDQYGLDADELAAELKKVLAGSTTVEDGELMVQGFWDVALKNHLDKAGIPPDSLDVKAGSGKSQKKDKKASNVVKY